MEVNIKKECFFELDESGRYLDQKFIFDGFGSLVVLGNIIKTGDVRYELDNGIGSENWLTEESDLFIFGEDLKLKSLILKMPLWNKVVKDVDFKSIDGLFDLKLIGALCYVIEPMKYRFLDLKKRRLLAFNDSFSEIDAREYKLSDYFCFLINESGSICGWVLYEPLKCVSRGFDSDKLVDVDGEGEYYLLDSFFRVVSDDFCENCDDDMEEVVGCIKEILDGFDVDSVNKDFYKMFSEEVEKLVDFHC